VPEKVFPPRFEKNGTPYIPTAIEMRSCGFASRDGGLCPRLVGIEREKNGAPSQLVDCLTCPSHSGIHLTSSRNRIN